MCQQIILPYWLRWSSDTPNSVILPYRTPDSFVIILFSTWYIQLLDEKGFTYMMFLSERLTNRYTTLALEYLYPVSNWSPWLQDNGFLISQPLSWPYPIKLFICHNWLNYGKHHNWICIYSTTFVILLITMHWQFKDNYECHDWTYQWSLEPTPTFIEHSANHYTITYWHLHS